MNHISFILKDTDRTTTTGPTTVSVTTLTHYTSMTTTAAAVVNAILALTSLVPSLPQSVTNGASVLGLLSAPTLSLIGAGGISSWGSDTVNNTNPYTGGPVSGKSYFTLVDLAMTEPCCRNRAYLQLQHCSRLHCSRWSEQKCSSHQWSISSSDHRSQLGRHHHSQRV